MLATCAAAERYGVYVGRGWRGEWVAGSYAGPTGAPQLRGTERTQPTTVWLFKSCFVKMRLFRGATN